ncbi:unnamed protein product [Thlaspi arvense]|uniref:Glabrous enhancer-binding protein-like DBD domain-containing protein n=1 Tax=Thlaspi arvense TaxID=13288 RepID=A0AAU9S6C3_THLAR|nr:unnamed protein product [Thlaspi arvense]
MVVRKRLRRGSDSIFSDSDCSGFRHSPQPLPSSPLASKRDDGVSGTESMLRRRKQPKKTAKPLVSSSGSKMIWSKYDELVILGSIVDYENETKLSYRSDRDGFYGYIKDFIEADFSKQQLMDKIRNLNKRFTINQARSNDGKDELSFTDTDDDEIFKLSMIIWGTNETERASNEDIDQAKDVPYERVDENIDKAKVLVPNEDVPCVEHERVDENMDKENRDHDLNKDVPCVEHERVDDNIDQAKVLDSNKDVPCVEHERVSEDIDQEKDVRYAEPERVNENMDQENVASACSDVPYAEHERVNENIDQEHADVPDAEHEPVSNITMETDKGEKEKSEEELYALQDALEATTLFQSLGRYQQKYLLGKLKKLGAQRRRELTDEWKALLAEELSLYSKKLTLSAKLAEAGVSS